MFIAKLFSESVYENDSEAFLAATSEQREAIKHHNFIARKVCQIIDLPTEEFEKQTKEELSSDISILLL